MKNEKTMTRSGLWSWSAITIFLLAFAAVPITSFFLDPHGGDESMAAALNGAYVATGIFIFGVPIAVIAYVKEKERRILSRVCAVLYALPIVAFIYCLVVYVRGPDHSHRHAGLNGCF